MEDDRLVVGADAHAGNLSDLEGRAPVVDADRVRDLVVNTDVLDSSKK